MIPLSVPELRGREWEYVKECLDSGWISTAGPMVVRFERRLADYVGVPHAVGTSSGTAALHVALLAAGVQPGDLVLVPSLTFIASVNPIRYCGAEPVFLDSDPETGCLDVQQVADYLADSCAPGTPAIDRATGRPVRALVAVHLYGHPCDMEPLVETCRRHGLRVIEDAAESLGARYRGRHTGTFGDVAALSFNGNKTITTGGGGMVLSSDDAIATRARYLVNQARDHAIEFVHHDVGFNYRLTALQSALGLAQMELVDEFVEAKRRHAAGYQDNLKDAVRFLTERPWARSSRWLNAALLAPGRDHSRAIARLAELGVESRPFFTPVHTLRPYAACRAHAPAAVELHARGITLPSSVGLTAAQHATVCDAVRRIAGESP